MSNLKLIKYPGSKSALVPTIESFLKRSGADVFIDVFGGSGVVSLNVGAKYTIYNDLNRELYNLFNTIKTSPAEFLTLAEKWTSTKDQFERYGVALMSGRVVSHSNVESAFKTFYKFNVGFGGMGSTYRTKKEKSSYSLILRILKNYGAICQEVLKWSIENSDFREVFREHDSKGVFFFFDPPYTGKSWYDFDFNIRALEDVKKIFNIAKGNYFCTFDSNDLKSREVFGEPNFVAEFESQKRLKSSTSRSRNYSIYHNVEM